jgi:hypothetical protein
VDFLRLMISNNAFVLIIGVFLIKICFVFRASDFEFAGQTGVENIKTRLVPARSR